MNKSAHVVDFDTSSLTYGSGINSKKYNDIINSLKTSVIRSINRSRVTNTRLSDFLKVVSAENTVLAEKIGQYKQLIETKGVGVAVVTGYDEPEVGYTNCFVDKNMGQVTVGYAEADKYSKIVRSTDGDGNVIASLDTYITINDNPVPRTDSIYNILDGRSDTFWVADVADVAVDGLIKIDIQFPTSLRPMVNNLVIKPFPAFTFDIQSITIQKFDSTVTELISTPTVDGVANLSLHFAPTSWNNRLTMILKPRGDVVGISKLDVNLINYSTSRATIKYRVPYLESVAFSEIKQVELVDFRLYNETPGFVKEDQYRINVYSGGGSAIPVSKDTILGTASTSVSHGAGDSFYIELDFPPYLGQSPVFRLLKIII